jgi:hypothetical protein
MIAVDITKNYCLSMFKKGSGDYTYLYTRASIYFYDAASNFLGLRGVIATNTFPSWVQDTAYVYPADFALYPTTTQVKIRLRCDGRPSGVAYHYWDLVTFGEVGAVQATFPIDAHEGRYLPVGAISFAATNPLSDITLQAMLATLAGDEITPSINPMTVDPGDPNTKFVDVAMLSPRVPVITVPTHRISGLADKANIEQVIRLFTQTGSAVALWYDYLGIIPIDRAYSEVRNWSGNDHLILDGRSSHLALTSLTGSLDDAQTWDINQQKGDASFVADPKGFNGAILALTNTSGDYEVTSVVDVTMKYCPLYLLIPEG